MTDDGNKDNNQLVDIACITKLLELFMLGTETVMMANSQLNGYKLFFILENMLNTCV